MAKDKNNNLIEEESIEYKLNSYLNVTNDYIQTVITKSTTTLNNLLEDNDHEKGVYDYNLFPNKDAMKTAINKFCQKYAIADTFLDDVLEVNDVEVPDEFYNFNNEIAIFLSDGTDKSIVKQSSRYLSAILERQKGNFEPMRKIIKDIFAKDKTNSPFSFDYNNPDEIFNYKTTSRLYGWVDKLLAQDQEFYKEICKDKNFEHEFKTKSYSYSLTRKFKDREIGVSIDRVIPIIINDKMDIAPNEDALLCFGTHEEEFMTYTVIKALDDYLLNKNENPRFIVSPASLGVKAHNSKESYDPANFETIEQLRDVQLSINSKLHENNTTGMQYAVHLANDFISMQKLITTPAEYQKEFSREKDTFGKQYSHDTIFIGEESLDSLVVKEMAKLKEKYPEKSFDNIYIAPLIIAKALEDPTKVISTSFITKAEDGSLKFKVVPLEKDYTMAVNASKESHGYLRRFLHIFGWKYPEESLQKKQNAAIKQFKENNSLKTIEEKINTEMKSRIEEFTKKYELNNDISLENNKGMIIEEKISNRERISINLDNEKSKDITKLDIKESVNEKVNDIKK